MDHYAKVSNPPKQRFTSVTYKPLRTYVRLSRSQKGGVIQGKKKKQLGTNTGNFTLTLFLLKGRNSSKSKSFGGTF